MIKTAKTLLKSALLVVAAAMPALSMAGDYPEKTITLVVPFNPGGGVDTVARILADQLHARFNQTVIVDNKPGGSGMIGAQAVVNASADGYTLLLASAGESVINEFVFKERMKYAPAKDLAPITLVTRIPNVMVINPKLPVNNIEEFMAYAKKNPDGVTYGTSGFGNTQHLNGELLNTLGGISMLQVPYKGASNQLVDVASGDVDVTFVSYTSVSSFIADGKVRPIAVTSAKRAEFAPDIPAIAEYQPLADYQLENWFGLFAPAGTPDDVLQKLNEAVVAALQNEELASRLRNMGGIPAPMSRAEFNDFLASERTRSADIVTRANITAN